MNSAYKNTDRYPALLFLVQRENVGCVKTLLLFDAHGLRRWFVCSLEVGVLQQMLCRQPPWRGKSFD